MSSQLDFMSRCCFIRAWLGAHHAFSCQLVSETLCSTTGLKSAAGTHYSPTRPPSPPVEPDGVRCYFSSNKPDIPPTNPVVCTHLSKEQNTKSAAWHRSFQPVTLFWVTSQTLKHVGIIAYCPGDAYAANAISNKKLIFNDTNTFIIITLFIKPRWQMGLATWSVLRQIILSHVSWSVYSRCIHIIHQLMENINIISSDLTSIFPPWEGETDIISKL